jgi:hypothetical protein
MATNTFGINYTDKKLHILFNGETHVFDLTEGDTGDFWSGFVTSDGKEWDVSFHQEDDTCEPNVSVYPAVWVGDENGSYEIDTTHEITLACIASQGNAEEYFKWPSDSIVTKPLQEGDLIGNRFRVTKLRTMAEEQGISSDKTTSDGVSLEYVNDMKFKTVITSKENVDNIKKSLLSIIAKINDNGIGAWNADLENTVEAVALEDYYGDVEQDEPTAKYNGWYEDLEKLLESL